jgi:hypothetical protein
MISSAACSVADMVLVQYTVSDHSPVAWFKTSDRRTVSQLLLKKFATILIVVLLHLEATQFQLIEKAVHCGSKIL